MNLEKPSYYHFMKAYAFSDIIVKYKLNEIYLAIKHYIIVCSLRPSLLFAWSE